MGSHVSRTPAWEAAREALQQNRAALAWELVAEETPHRPWHAGVFIQAARAVGQSARAHAALQAVDTGPLRLVADLQVAALFMQTAPLPVEPDQQPALDADAVVRMPIHILAGLLEGMVRTAHPLLADVVAACAQRQPWAGRGAHARDMGGLLAVLHPLLEQEDPEAARDLAWWAWCHAADVVEAVPLLDRVPDAWLQEHASEDDLHTHLLLRRHVDPQGAVDAATRWCGGALQVDGTAQRMLGLEAWGALHQAALALGALGQHGQAQSVLHAVARAREEDAAAVLMDAVEAMEAAGAPTTAVVSALRTLADAHPEDPTAAEALLRTARLLDATAPAEAEAARRSVLASGARNSVPVAHWELAWRAHLAARPDDARHHMEALLGALRQPPERTADGRHALFWRARWTADGHDAATQMAALVRACPHTFHAALARGWLQAHGRKVPHTAALPPAAAPAEPDLSDVASVVVAAQQLEELGLDAQAAQLLGIRPLWDLKPLAPWLLHRLLQLGHASRVRTLRMGVWEPLMEAPRADTAVLWHLQYPVPWKGLFASAARNSGVPLALLLAVARVSSRFHPAHRHARGPWLGLMGLRPEHAPSEDPLDADKSVRCAARTLARLLEETGGHVPAAVAAYRASAPDVLAVVRGPGGGEPGAFARQLPDDALRIFVEDVLEDVAVYRLLSPGTEGPWAVPPASSS